MSEEDTYTAIYNHPMWKYCAIVQDTATGGYQVIAVDQPPEEVIEDWVERFGQLPYNEMADILGDRCR